MIEYTAAIHRVEQRLDQYRRVPMRELVEIGHFVAIPIDDLPRLHATLGQGYLEGKVSARRSEIIIPFREAEMLSSLRDLAFVKDRGKLWVRFDAAADAKLAMSLFG